MTWLLFLIGALTSLACGGNVLFGDAKTWHFEALWICGGTVGAAMMGAATWLNG